MTNKMKWKKSEEPVAVVNSDQTPVIPAFAPYTYDEPYYPEYSKTLVDKSNALAQSIWGSQESYDIAHQRKAGPMKTFGDDTAVAKNSAFFNKFALNRRIGEIFTIPRGIEESNWNQTQKLIDFVKKLKKLERTHDFYDLFGDDDHEKITSTILMPAQQFGVSQGYAGHNFIRLQYPSRPAVVNGLLTDEDANSLELLINYIPTIRDVLNGFKPWSNGYTAEGLTAPLLVEKKDFSEDRNRDRALLGRLVDLTSFFNRVLPPALIEDHIPGLRYPSPSTRSLQSLQTKSASLRDASSAFVREQKPLSELLNSILELSHALKEHFQTVAHELSLYFDYLGRIDMPFETLVTESQQRVKESDVPW